MVKPTTVTTIDLAASSRRVATARTVAERQARLVEAAGTSVDRLNIDLLFLTQETVLVLDETHKMLVTLSEKDKSAVVSEPPNDAVAIRAAAKAPSKQPIALLVQAVVLAVIAAFAIELIDPAPMDVFAFRANVPVLGP